MDLRIPRVPASGREAAALNLPAAPWADPRSASSALRREQPLLVALAEQRRDRVMRLLRGIQRNDLAKLAPSLHEEAPQGLAQAITDLLGPEELAARLMALGLDSRWKKGQLAQIGGCWFSVEEGRRGILITGPDVEVMLQRAFPELWALTLRCGTYTAGKGSGATPLVFYPPSTSGTAPEFWDLSGVSPAWVIVGAAASYTLGGAGLYNPYIWDPFGTDGSYMPVVDWNDGGLTWIHEHAGDSNASPGDMGLSVGWTEPPPPDQRATLTQNQLVITYEGTGGGTSVCPGSFGALALGAVTGSGTCITPPSCGSGTGTSGGLSPALYDAAWAAPQSNCGGGGGGGKKCPKPGKGTGTGGTFKPHR